MENFFIDDRFYSDITDLIDDKEFESFDDIPEDWSEKAESATLEPLFTYTPDSLAGLIIEHHEDRLGEEDETERIVKIISECVDFEKLAELTPKYYYANNQFFIITKKDLEDGF